MICLPPALLGQFGVVQSRHPSRYPKLSSLTLSYPAFEPLARVSRFFHGLVIKAGALSMPSVSMDVVSVPGGAKQITAGYELRTSLILLQIHASLQAELTMATITHRGMPHLGVSFLRGRTPEPVGGFGCAVGRGRLSTSAEKVRQNLTSASLSETRKFQRFRETLLRGYTEFIVTMCLAGAL